MHQTAGSKDGRKGTTLNNLKCVKRVAMLAVYFRLLERTLPHILTEESDPFADLDDQNEIIEQMTSTVS